VLKLFFLIFLLLSGYLVGCFFLYLPISYENQVYATGIDSEYLKLPKNIDKLMMPNVVETFGEENVTSRYKKFYLGEFSFSLPIDDPTIVIRPQIKVVGKQVFYGFILEDYSGVELLKVEYTGKKRFELNKLQDKIFSLEISKNILVKKKPIDLYNDIFGKIISKNHLSYLDVVKSPRLLLEGPIYNFYLLQQRIFFGVDENTYFFKKKNILGKTVKEDESLSTDYIEFHKSGKLYAFKVNYTSWRDSSKKFRNLFLSTLGKSSSRESIAIDNYNTFLSNPYERRSELKNIIYLFSAWSMDFDDVRYLKAMINTLERSKKFSSPLLNQLYDFSIKRFGETFSVRDEITKKYDSSSARFRKELAEEAKRSDKEDLNILEYSNQIESSDSGEEYLDKNIDIAPENVIED